MSDPFRAIMEERRRDILLLVREKEMSAGDIASHFSITRPAISQHIGILRDAGLLQVRREGTVLYYRANPAGLRALREFVELFWDKQLGSLSRSVERAKRRGKDGRVVRKRNKK